MDQFQNKKSNMASAVSICYAEQQLCRTLIVGSCTTFIQKCPIPESEI